MTDEMTFDQILAEASLAETEVRLCLSGKLRNEYAKITERIDKARAAAAADERGQGGDFRLATKPADTADDKALAELLERMRRHTVTFTLPALAKQEWNDLWAKHPPRRGGDGRTDQRDQSGFNSTTFWPEVIRKSIVSPELSDAQWTSLNSKITDVQFDKLGQATWLLNRAEEDIPLPPAA